MEHSSRWFIIFLIFFSCKSISNEKSHFIINDTITYELVTFTNRSLGIITVIRYSQNNGFYKKFKIDSKYSFYRKLDSQFYRIDSTNIYAVKGNNEYKLYSFDSKNSLCNNDTIFPLFFPFNVFNPNYSIKKDVKTYKIKNKVFYIYKFRQTDNYSPNSNYWAYFLKDFDFILYADDARSLIRISEIRSNSKYTSEDIKELNNLIMEDTCFFEPKVGKLIPLPEFLR
jgi:hypothetical protein